MKHNEIAAKFRNILRKRGISVELVPWDKVIYDFARNNQHESENTISKTINWIIDRSIYDTQP